MPDEAAVEIKMWTCKKYPSLSVMATNAAAFCARRFERSKHETSVQAYSRCATCERGAAMYLLEKHKAGGETKQRKDAPIRAKGGTKVAPEKTFTKKCETHGEYVTSRSNGACQKCKEAKDQGGTTKPVKKSQGRIAPPPSVPAPLSGSEAGGGALSVSIDLARFPRLHSRLITVGLNTMLAELETKA